MPYEPPVPANQLRPSLMMLVRRARMSDDLDVDAAITLVAEQRPLVQLPRLIEQSTARGAALVADVGAGMLPYLHDVARLVAEFRQIVGASRLVVDWVEDGAAQDGRPLRPEPGRPTVLLTTLGATQPPSAHPGAAARWLLFADAAREAGADITALVPHRGHRWPAGLTRSLRVVAWDELADVGRGHG